MAQQGRHQMPARGALQGTNHAYRLCSYSCLESERRAREGACTYSRFVGRATTRSAKVKGKHGLQSQWNGQRILSQLSKSEALAPGETSFKTPRDVGDGSDTVLRRNSVLSSKVLQANFRNQAKVYEAEQQHIEEAKKREIAKAEFQAEQDYLKTLSYLSSEEQEKFKERQGVQFLYMKPPGADSMAASGPKAAQEGTQAASRCPITSAAVQEVEEKDRPPHREPQRSYVGSMLGAVRALQNHDKWDVRHVTGVHRSPPRGQADVNADNQTILVSSGEDEEEIEQGSGHKKKQRRVDDRLAEAETVLRQAGYDLEKLKNSRERSSGSSDKRKSKKSRKSKRKDRGPQEAH